MMEHSKEWLRLRCDSKEKYVFDYDSGVDGKAYFFVHPVRLQFFFGDRAIAGLKVQRFVLTCNLRNSIEFAKSLIEYMSDIIINDRVIYLQGVVEGESITRIIENGFVAKYFKVLTRGNPYKRRLVNLKENFEQYLESLPAKSRQDIRRTLKKFSEVFPQRYKVIKYNSCSEIKALFNVISGASSRTYQAKNLGLGLVKNSYVEQEFIQGARLGYSNCYVLYIDDRPVAWRLGYCFDGVYYSHHIGYDPEYKKNNPGVVLQLLTIKDLTENRKDIHQIDMLYGDNDVKKKLSNGNRVESNYYLFPKNFRGYLNYGLMASFDSFVGLVSDCLSRFNLKDKLKYFMR